MTLEARFVAWIGAAAMACSSLPRPAANSDEARAPAHQASLAAPSESSRAAVGADAGDSAVSPTSEWTAGIVRREPGRDGTATLRGVRVGRHAGFDRVVFDFDGRGLPGRHFEYVDKPVRGCGSGEPKPLLGDAWLAVTFEPAAAHTDAGAPTLVARELFPDLPIVREIELTCDFEAQVTVVFGVSRPNRFRVLELADPPRVVVDVRH